MASTVATTVSSTKAYLDSGVTSIATSTASASPGLWYRVHPKVRNIGFHMILTGSSAGAPVSGAVQIEASNGPSTAPVPLATVLGSMTVTTTASSPWGDGLAVDAHWAYVRAVVGTGTTQSSGTSVDVLAAPHGLN